MMVQAKSGAASGGVFYVSPVGSDSNPGTLEQPWKTIQKAADTMEAGDAVNVLSGDYSAERIDISKSGTSGLPITYKAEGTAVTRGFTIAASYITISGFEVANSAYQEAGILAKGA